MYFKSPQNLSQWQARWSMFMQDYDLVWDNHPGSQMGPADALSRRDEVDTSLDNTAITMLPSVSDVLICALGVRLAERIANFTATDPLVKDATDAMAQHSSLFPHAARDDWTFLDSALYYKSRLYVPKPTWQELVTLCTVPRLEDMADISAPFTWFNATTGGPDLPPSFADLWLAALFARPTRSSPTPLSRGSGPPPPTRSSKSLAT